MKFAPPKTFGVRRIPVAQRGIALAIAIILLGVMLVFTSVSATIMTSEARQSSSQYQNTRTYNAAMAYLESMTNNFNVLFSINQNPSPTDISNLTDPTKAPKLKTSGGASLYRFTADAPYVPPSVGQQRTTQIKTPPYDGLNAIERRYVLGATARAVDPGGNDLPAESRIIRELSNYQVPIFQFAAFGFDNLEISPGPRLDLGGRAHVNRHLFLSGSNGPINFWGRVTVVGQVCTLVKINGFANGGSMTVYQPSSNSLVAVQPSVPSGTAPDFTSGTAAVVSPNVDWNIDDDPATPNAGGGTPGTAGPTGLVISNVAPLLLPTQTQNFNPIEIIRRANPNEQQFLDPPDNTLVNPLLSSRYFNARQPVQGSVIRILLDDDLADFPTGGPGPVAYDFDRLSNPQDGLFNAFWMANNPNVRQFDPDQGSDLPDAPPATNPAGTGGAPQTFNNLGAPVNAIGQRVLPPQTNIVNRQPEFQSDGNNGTVNTLRKRTYIKIELLVNNNPPNAPTRYDITPHILNMGITSGPIPMTTVNGTAPTGVESSMTYNAVYALNDGGSIRRLQNPTTGDTPANMLPFLSESNTTAFIGEFAQHFGQPPSISLSAGAGTQSVQTTYWFEPNSILTFQRTNIPFSPQNYQSNLTEHVSMTYADVQTVSDRGVNVNSVLQGRIDNNGLPTNAANAYPAKFKSLIAKPYFRFTDDFLNSSYVKGSFDAGPDGVTGNADDTFLMVNPFSLPKTQVFNDESPRRDDKRMERFARKIRVCAARVRTSTGVVGTGTPQPDTTTPRYPVTQLASSSTGPLNPSVTLTSANPTVVPNFTTDYDRLLRNNTNFWTNNPSAVGENGRRLKIQRTINNFLRQNIFVPGIPGFYAMANNNRNFNGTLNTGAGYEQSGVDVLGDGLLDNEIGLNNGFAGPNTNLNTTTTTAATAGAVPTDYVPSTNGVIDLQELTPFANISNSNLLQKCLFNPSSLTAAEQERMFPHLLQESRTQLLNQILTALEVGTPGRNTDPALAGFNVNGTPEISKENLVFDWNGDGRIEPPHLPFQNGSTIPETVGDTAATPASSVGYSVESNICSLLPSSLRVLHDQPANNALNTTLNATTSKPIELIFWEADVDGSNGGGTANTWDTTTYQGQTLTNADFAALTPIVPGSVNLAGQADPGSQAQAAVFAPSVGFTETGANRNCWRIKVPYNTFGGTVTVGAGSQVVNVREAVGIIFQHPVASRVYNNEDPSAVDPKTAVMIDPTAIGPNTSGVGAGVSKKNLNLETQIGRRLGQGDAHYSFPGHAFLAFQPNANPLLPPISTAPLIPKLRIQMDQAFPINAYDQREGRHFARNYAFQGIATAGDYYASNVGGGGGQIFEAQWPDFPGSGTGDNQLLDSQRILSNMGLKLPQPSPVSFERRGVMNVAEFNMGNLKRLFRGDFNSYLAQADALTATVHTFLGAGTNPGAFIDGRPKDNPNTPEVEGTSTGLIDITDNGFIVYYSDRRGDDNNDGIYEFNDVFGENNNLDELDNCIENDSTYDGIANSPGPKPGDNLLRRDVEVETQPFNAAGNRRIPDINNPARSGEAPHGSVPANDGFEYYSGNIIREGTRRRRVYNPDGTFSLVTDVNNGTMLPADALLTQLSTTGLRQGGGGTAGEGGVFWRMVDSAKTGRVRAFRHVLRVINAQDIPRWYISRPNGQDRGFTGMALVTEGPMYSYGNVNTIGVEENLASTAPIYSFDNIAIGGPTRSEDYCQTGNANRPAGESMPANFGTDPANPNDPILHGSLSMMADGITIQSNAWSDGRMFICPFGTTKRPQTRIRRYAARTFVKAAWLTGTGKAGDGQNNITGQVQSNNNDAADMSDSDANNTQGGLHNFPRFTEDWGGSPNGASSNNFNYNGSFIFQFYSHQANGPWMIRGPGTDGGTSLYNAPNPRNWNFDVSFTRANGIPPGTPRLTFYKNGSFRQIFLENNPN